MDSVTQQFNHHFERPVRIKALDTRAWFPHCRNAEETGGKDKAIFYL